MSPRRRMRHPCHRAWLRTPEARSRRTPRAPTTPAARALALVEVVLSIAILGGLTAAVMTAVGRAALTRARTVERIQGSTLAENLMAEVLAQSYIDTTPPAATTGVSLNLLGITVTLSSPSGSPSRASFDALDDYDGWRSSPPLDRAGNVIPGYSGWQQSVDVEIVPLATPNAAEVGADTGLKRITVIIRRDGREISRMVALRSLAWEEALDAR